MVAVAPLNQKHATDLHYIDRGGGGGSGSYGSIVYAVLQHRWLSPSLSLSLSLSPCAVSGERGAGARTHPWDGRAVGTIQETLFNSIQSPVRHPGLSPGRKPLPGNPTLLILTLTLTLTLGEVLLDTTFTWPKVNFVSDISLYTYTVWWMIDFKQTIHTS